MYPSKGAGGAALPRGGAGRGVRRRLSAVRAPRLGGVSRQILVGRGGRAHRKRGRTEEEPRRRRALFRVHVCARRASDGGLLLFRRGDRRRDGVLYRTRARGARSGGGGLFFLRRARGDARAAPIPQSTAEPAAVHAEGGGTDGALDGLFRQRQLPDVPRRARLLDLRRGGVRAFRQISARRRKDAGENGKPMSGTPRLFHRRNHGRRREAERLRDNRRRGQTLSDHFTYRAFGGKA